MYKTTLVLIVSFLYSQLISASINPDKQHYPLFKIYSTPIVVGGNYKLPGLSFDGHGVIKRRTFVHIPSSVFNKVKNMADSTFSVSSSKGEGSAVQVGENLVITSLHVISSMKSRIPRSCRIDFYSNAYYKSKTRFACKRILHCSKKLDYCLIEVSDSRRGQSTDKSKSARLKTNLRSLIPGGAELFSVGNTGGNGLHASSGFSFGLVGTNNLIYYASSFSGNSGGGVFTEDGDLIGIVRAQSKLRYGKKAFNTAVPLKAIREDLNENSNLSSTVLNKLNWITI